MRKQEECQQMHQDKICLEIYRQLLTLFSTAWKNPSTNTVIAAMDRDISPS